MSNSWSRFHQIITNWIVLKSTMKGLLKNAQDGNSRCFGGREINQKIVETILWDTLYNELSLLLLTISGYIWLSLAISWYLYQVSSFRVQVEAGENELLLFVTFSFFFIDTSYRGACAPQNIKIYSRPMSIGAQPVDLFVVAELSKYHMIGLGGRGVHWLLTW